MSDTVSKASMKELVGIMYSRLNVIEDLMEVIDKHYHAKAVSDRVVDEINEARRVLRIYQMHLLSTEQTDDFDGHPNTVI